VNDVQRWWGWVVTPATLLSMPKMAAQPCLLAVCPCIVQMWRAVMLATNWQELYEDAIFEINPDKLTSCIEEAEQAIAQRESFVDITQAERHRLADARSVLKSLSRIALP